MTVGSGPSEVDEQIAIAAPPSTVWAALVDADRRRNWWSYLDLDPVRGGRFTERWRGPDGEEVTTSGSVVEIVSGRLLRLEWADEKWPSTTEVEITLSPDAAGTLVRVRHSGWEGLPDGRRVAEEHRAGWQTHLRNLRRVVESEMEDLDDPSPR